MQHRVLGHSRTRCGVQVLLEKGVEEGRILFLTLIAAPEGIHRVCRAYPRIKIITSEIDEGMEDLHVVPGGDPGKGTLWWWAWDSAT